MCDDFDKFEQFLEEISPKKQKIKKKKNVKISLQKRL